MNLTFGEKFFVRKREKSKKKERKKKRKKERKKFIINIEGKSWSQNEFEIW